MVRMRGFQTRRDFLEAFIRASTSGVLLRAGAITTMLPQALSAESQARDRRLLLIGDGDQGGGGLFTSKPPKAKAGAVMVLEKKSERWAFGRAVKTSFLPHAFCRTESGNIWTFEKWYRQAAIIDIRGGRLTKSIVLPEYQRFFGHGACLGDKVYASIMNDRTSQGQVGVFSENGQLLDFFSSGGAYPHDCQIDRRTGDILVLNSRAHAPRSERDMYGSGELAGRSRLVWIDPGNGRQKKAIELGNPSGGYAHFFQMDSGELYLTGSGYESGRSISMCAKVSASGELITMKGGRLPGESLSVSVGQDKCVAMTFPGANRVLIWSGSGELLRDVPIQEARSVWWDESTSNYLVSSAGQKKLFVLDSEGKLIRGDVAKSSRLGTGSHFFVHS